MVWLIQYLVLFNLILSDMSSGTFESKFESKLSLSSDGVWREQVKTVLLVNNELLGLTRAQQQSAYGQGSQRRQQRLVYPAITPFFSWFVTERRSTCVTLRYIFSRYLPTGVQLSIYSGSSPWNCQSTGRKSRRQEDHFNLTILQFNGSVEISKL